MEFIAHRVNTIDELEQLSGQYGVELDLRDDLSGRIYIQHNPFEDGEDFEDYLKVYKHSTMILNVKSERIEERILDLLNKYGVNDYFFLDSSFPMIFLLSQRGEKNIAIRYSEFEGMDTVKMMSGRVNWVWVDCFTRLPIDKLQEIDLHNMGYKLCLVSPELQGRDEDIEVYAKVIQDTGLEFDAICTKQYNINRWRSYLKI